MLEIYGQELPGNWPWGFALDLHSTGRKLVSATEDGVKRYLIERPPVSDLLFQFKTLKRREAASKIIEAAAAFIRPQRSELDVIVPVPPSRSRPLQPVEFLAKGIGAAADLPVAACISITRPAMEMKRVEGNATRKAIVAGLYAVDLRQTRAKNILLFDDTYRTGTTLNAIADLLIRQGKAKSVRVLTITKAIYHKR